MQTKEIRFENPGVLCMTAPQDIFSELKDSCLRQLTNKNINYNLKRAKVTDLSVSGIEEVIWAQVPQTFVNFLEDCSREYVNFYQIENLRNLKPAVVHNWLNLQKRYEYRPIHRHYNGKGNGLSFVAYIQIPYDLEIEDQHSNHHKKATVHRNGRIEFMYSTYNGQITSKLLDIDKTYEGKVLIFSNELWHIVYPFYTSEDYRVSLAGNIELS